MGKGAASVVPRVADAVEKARGRRQLSSPGKVIGANQPTQESRIAHTLGDQTLSLQFKRLLKQVRIDRKMRGHVLLLTQKSAQN